MNDRKPFNAEHAKAGAPYGCRNGNQATVLKWDAQNRDFPLVGTIIFSDSSEQPESWTINGMRAVDMGEGESDLVMLQLGYIDGKPVFVGDEYEFGEVRYRAVPNGSGGFDNCRWPEPAKQYPETQMGGYDLHHVYVTTPGRDVDGCMVAVANAALRHAIDNGYAATKEAYDQCNAELAEAEALLEALGCTRVTDGKESGWTVPDRAARDLAVADAVRSYCDVAAEDIDLAAIIAKVKP